MPKDNRICTIPDYPEQLSHVIDVASENLRTGRRCAPHPGALLSFAAHLPASSRLVLSFSVNCGSEQGLRVSARLDEHRTVTPDHRLAADLPRALRMAFPGSTVAPVAKDQEHLPIAMRLQAPRYDGAGYLQAVGLLDPRATSRLVEVSTPLSDTVILPSPMARPTPLVAILEALVNADQSACLVVSIGSIRLEAFALRQISVTMEQIDIALSDPLLPLVERVRLDRARDGLRGWQNCPAGASAELRLESEESLPDWLTEALGTAAHGYHAPDVMSVPESGVDLSLAWSRSDAPRIALPGPVAMQRLVRRATASVDRTSSHAEGVVIGQTSAGQPVKLSDHLRGQHLYLCGATGTGKSSLIRRMVRDDVSRGFGVAVIDPHGDLIEDLRDDLGTGDVLGRIVIADLSQAESGFRMNLLENDGLASGHHANFVANQLIMAFTRILYRDVPDAFGPMFASYFRNALMLLMLGSEEQAHLGDFDRVFTDRSFRKALLERCPDEHVRRFWTGLAQRVTHTDASLENIAPYIVSKLTMFVSNPMLRPILCATKSSLDFYGAMQRGDVFLANLAKGVAGEADSKLMGALLTTKLFAAAMRRGQLPREERRPFRIYLDEFQSYGTDLIGDMLAEGRKFGLELTLANQSTSQIDGRNRGDDIAHAILANCGTVLAFRTSPLGAPLMANWIGDGVEASDLVKLPNYTVVGRLPTTNGIPMTRRFQTVPD